MAKMHISWHIIFIRLLLNHFSIFYVQFQKQKCVQELRQPKSSNTFNFKDINLWQCEVLFSYNNFSPNWLDVEKAIAPHSCLENPIDVEAWWAAVHGIAKDRTRLSDFTFNFHFHTLEKEMAAHSSVLAWRIPGTGKPGRLPSMGSHRVRHDWSDLA